MVSFQKLFLFSFLLAALTTQAQRFGGNPPSVKWRQVNNPAAKVIFPRGLDSVAMQVAGIVQRLNLSTQPSIGPLHKPVSIVLHNETTLANAYVALGPFRSEFYLTPEQNSFSLGSLPWYEQLAIHEFRHVQQYNNFNVGLSKVMRVLFGEEGQALANSAAIPDWFFEGDAVYNETNVSWQGRGRLPAFFNDYRSLWLAGKDYSWMKLRNGSYRDFVPDHYHLGYMLAAYGREKWGNDFWKKVTHDAAAYKGLFYPLQKAVKTHSGESYQQFRREAFDYFKTETGATSIDERSVSRHFLADEEFPAFLNDSTIVYMKSSYRRIPAFTVRTGNKETKLRVRDISLDNYFSYRNGKIVYASYRPDLRWTWKEYSDLQILDVQTGQERTLTNHTKYFSPDISEDGTLIVAVQVDPDGTNRLQLLDANSGSATKSFPNPDNVFFTYPKFWSSGRIISAVRNPAGEMSLALTDAAAGTTRYLLPFTRNVIGFPFVQHDTVYFSASQAKLDRLFAYDLQQKKLFQLQHPLLESVTGKYAPSANRNRVLWSDFTASGYRIQQAGKGEMDWKEISLSQLGGTLSDFGIASVNKNPLGNQQEADKLSVSKYSKSYRLFNFHSLEPLADDPVYSFSLVGENVLNTLQSELFFNYNRNEQYKQLGFNAVYGGWFPYVSGGITQTFDRRALYHGRRIYWNESELSGGLNLPLNLSKGKNSTSLNIGSNYVFNRPQFRGMYKDSLGNRSYGYVSSFLVFTNQVQRARQQIYPRFAQSLTLSLRNAVSKYTANQFLASAYLYLPGAFINHNLVLNAAFQQRDTLQQRIFSNGLPFSRGYTAENLRRMYKWSANYHFPLFYPDWGFANIVYFLRVRANLFYDQTYLRDFYRTRQPFKASLRSAGTEVFFDTRWWNQLPVNFGFRYSYLLDRDLFGGAGRNRYEVVLPVNLLGR
ncbi:MAG: hypothetical protein INR73_25470 [Williamsia sp.]|nr:hypothetical protein [Williamsia sp.]